MKCPLCESKKVIKLETIKKNDLINLYQKMTDIDFGYLINQDIDYCECQECKLRYFDPLVSGDEKFYNALQKFEWYYMDEKEEYVYAKEYIKATDKVLEVGSGKGAFAKHIGANNYIGLDFSENAKKMAAENGITIENEMIQDYAENHKEEFDVVVSFQVLEHVSDPKSFIESKLQALKVGGKLIIAVPSEDSFLKYVNNGILNMPPHHVTRWCDKTFKYIADTYNLTIETIYHERVQGVHKKLYLNTFIANSFSKNKLINTSLTQKIKNKFASLISKFLYKGLKEELLPNGHTVLVVFDKK
ncbi:MAG: class I SAM-dependent methyltransferase [Aliarcobacter butzleri]|nr:class I SAM-dependent methyltransferase [Aliarcobacter butzleri]